jgi:5-methyltetrahydrofolate--homocysteine methyltransferase
MAMAAGMTSAIMNPVQIPVSQKKIAAKLEELAAAGIIVAPDIDPELLAKLTGMGSTQSRPGKEMEAIRAANFLTDNDANGSEWIKFNKSDDGVELGARGRRTGGRRRK